eukprot:6714228-Pyramimonas_sp.AAC.1
MDALNNVKPILGNPNDVQRDMDPPRVPMDFRRNPMDVQRISSDIRMNLVDVRRIPMEFFGDLMDILRNPAGFLRDPNAFPRGSQWNCIDFFRRPMDVVRYSWGIQWILGGCPLIPEGMYGLPEEACGYPAESLGCPKGYGFHPESHECPKDSGGFRRTSY